MHRAVPLVRGLSSSSPAQSHGDYLNFYRDFRTYGKQTAGPTNSGSNYEVPTLCARFRDYQTTGVSSALDTVQGGKNATGKIKENTLWTANYYPRFVDMIAGIGTYTLKTVNGFEVFETGASSVAQDLSQGDPVVGYQNSGYGSFLQADEEAVFHTLGNVLYPTQGVYDTSPLDTSLSLAGMAYNVTSSMVNGSVRNYDPQVRLDATYWNNHIMTRVSYIRPNTAKRRIPTPKDGIGIGNSPWNPICLTGAPSELLPSWMQPAQPYWFMLTPRLIPRMPPTSTRRCTLLTISPTT